MAVLMSLYTVGSFHSVWDDRPSDLESGLNCQSVDKTQLKNVCSGIKRQSCLTLEMFMWWRVTKYMYLVLFCYLIISVSTYTLATNIVLLVVARHFVGYRLHQSQSSTFLVDLCYWAITSKKKRQIPVMWKMLIIRSNNCPSSDKYSNL